jgi:hypothetical protein
MQWIAARENRQRRIRGVEAVAVEPSLRQRTMNDDNSEEPIIAHWPGNWPGRSFVNLDCVGDPGDWIDLQISSAEEVLFDDPNDEEMAMVLADAYIAAGRELAFPLPTDFGMSEETMREKAVEDFLAFIREWRKRTIAERKAAQKRNQKKDSP